MKKIILLSIFSFFLQGNIAIAQTATSLGTERNKGDELLIGFNRRSDAGSWWSNPNFKTLVAEINPEVLRYPGGTQANYWDWRTGEFIPGGGKNWASKETLTIPDFLGHIPTDTKVVYVVNIARPASGTGVAVDATEAVLKSAATLDKKIDDMLAALQKFSDNGKLPYAIELGNEFYFGNEEGGIFEITENPVGTFHAGWNGTSSNSYNDDELATTGNAEYYMDICKVVIDKIRLTYPTMKFVLATTKRGNGHSKKEAWNDPIYDELNNNATFSNKIYAVSQHFYISTNDGDQTVVHDVPTAKTAIIEGVFYPRDWDASYQQTPAAQKIWYTEYGVSKENAETMWATGLRSAAYTLSWIDRGDKVGQLDYHHIGSENVTTPNKPDATEVMELAPIGITSSVFSKASYGMDKMTKISFSGNTVIADGVESLHGYKFKSAEKETVLIMNLNDQDFNSIDLDAMFTYPGTRVMTQYWSSTPHSTNPTIGSGITEIKSNVTSTFDAKEFSITVIEVYNSTFSTTWIGETSDVWTDATNWSNGVPADGYDVTIDKTGANNPKLPDSGNLIVNNLTVSSYIGIKDFISEITGELIVNSTAKIFGKITIGKIVNNKNIELKKGAKVTVTGSLINNAGSQIKIISEVAGTGSLITKGTVEGTGTYIVKRWIEGILGDEKWHLVSSPVATESTGVFRGHYLNEYDDANGHFNHILAEDIPLIVADGFIVKHEGVLDGSATDIISFEGTFNTGSFNDIPVVTTVNERGNNDSSGNPVNRDVSNSHFDLPIGFNLVGNPYPAGLNWDKVYYKGKNNSTNITPYMYYFLDGTVSTDPDHTPKVKSGWQVYKATDPDAGGYSVADDAIVSSGQGFGVVALNNVAGLFSIPASARVNAKGKGFGKKQIENANSFELVAISGGYIDCIEYVVNNNATTAYDVQYDAFKLNSFSNSPNVSFIGSDNNKFAVNSSPKETSINLGFNMNVGGEVVLSLNNVVDFTEILIEDKTENIFTDLIQGDYTFQHSTTDTEFGRFTLHFSNEALSEKEENLDLKVYSFGKIVYISSTEKLKDISVKLFNMSGQEMFAKQYSSLNKEEINTNLNYGIYILEVTSNRGTTTQKISLTN